MGCNREDRQHHEAKEQHQSTKETTISSSKVFIFSYYVSYNFNHTKCKTNTADGILLHRTHQSNKNTPTKSKALWNSNSWNEDNKPDKYKTKQVPTKNITLLNAIFRLHLEDSWLGDRIQNRQQHKNINLCLLSIDAICMLDIFNYKQDPRLGGDNGNVYALLCNL